MRNLSGLTSLRFFAAIWVVAFHLVPNWSSLSQVGVFIHAGYSGVTLFFVLSGFILSYNYLPRDCGARAFWMARVARILPVYSFALVLSAPIFLYVCHAGGYPFLPAALSAPLLLQAWLPNAALLWNSPAWSLSCEAFFYLLFPFIAIPIARLFRRHFAVMFAATWVLAALPSLLYSFGRPEGLVGMRSLSHPLLDVIRFNPILRLPEFIMGIGIGTLYLDGRRLLNPRTVGAVCVLFIIGLIVLLPSVMILPYPAMHNGLLAPVYGVLILSIASAPEMLSNSFLILLGESSYSLYLLHWPIYNWCSWLARKSGWSNSGAVSLVALATALVISVASYKLIEVPGRLLIRSRLRTLETQ